MSKIRVKWKSQSPGFDFNGKFWDFFIANLNKRFIVLMGGAGSGKSHSVAQWIVHLLFKYTNARFLIVRKTMPSLKITAMQLILDLLDLYGLPYDLNKSAPVTLTAHGNTMIFRGLDDPEKVKSFEPHVVWMEETTDFFSKDFTQLNLRMRGVSDIQRQIFMSFNPVDKTFSWLYKRFWEQENTRAAVLHTTWRDNRKHLDDEYIEELEALEHEDKTTYEIYNLGLWGVLKNVIYENWGMVDAFPNVRGDVFYGLDFGYNHPMALVENRFVDGKLFEKELLYETHLTTPQLIDRMKILIPNRSDSIYADGQEPGSIAEIRLAGFNIRAGDKAVKHGIDFVKRIHINVIQPSVNLEKEKKGYKYKENEATGEVFDEPVKWMDDLMDAERYAIYTHLWKLLRLKVNMGTRKQEDITKEALGVL